jgi:hypothetical protein
MRRTIWPRIVFGCSLGVCAGLLPAGCAGSGNSSAPVQAAPPQPGADTVAHFRSEFLADMVTPFQTELRARTHTDQHPEKMVLALIAPGDDPDGQAVGEFYEKLADCRPLNDDFQLVRLLPGDQEPTAAEAPAAPDGSKPQQLYHPDSIYCLSTQYQETPLPAGGVCFSLQTSVTHPRSREIIMRPTLKRNLVWTGSDWTLAQ